MAWQSVLGLDKNNSLEDGLAGSNLTHVAVRPALGLAKRITQKTLGHPRFVPLVTAAEPHVAAEPSTLVGSEGQQKQKRADFGPRSNGKLPCLRIAACRGDN